jgi:HD-like signal output (HDOD) protein
MYQWLRQLFSTSAPGPGPAPGPVSIPAAPSPAAPALTADAAPPRPVSFEQLDRVNADYYGWLFGRDIDTGLDTNPLETQVLGTLAAILASQQSGAALVRRMPGLIPQLLQSLRSDTFSGAALSRTISGDVVLVAAVIRLANSSFKGTGTAITSVEHAVILIGQEGLRHLITSVAFRPIIDMQSGHYTRTLAPLLWEHSERCAVANRELAGAYGIDPFEAFLAGLVQNVGLIVALRIMDQATRDDKALGSEMFCAQLVRDARALTVSILREWNFPDSVTRALAEQDGMQKGAALSALGRLLSLSDYLGKVRMLVEQARLQRDDAALFAGLPADAGQCYAVLEAPEEA